MTLLNGAVPIESDDHVLRARRTAAVTRAVLGILGIVLILAQPHLLTHPALGIAGFATILVTALVQLVAPLSSWLKVEEAFAGSAAVLIVGLGNQQVTVLSILWLAAISTGVLARGGRVHWIGRTIVLGALALPAIRQGHVTADHAALCAATLGLLLTSGRLTRELNHLLRQARLDADNAETLLLAGDIASRVANRAAHDGDAGKRAPLRPEESLNAEERLSASDALERLIEGDGLAMAVQPIVDVHTGSIHAYEALARFGQPRADGGGGPLHWFALAEELGKRDALERACLRAALDLFALRPSGTRLSVNLSAPVLLDPLTLNMLHEAAARQPDALEGLIVEITEETLVQSDAQLRIAIGPLRAQGARLAVDDMGAGYAGLRQITTVHPSYLKLDRSLVSGIDHDGDRAALVGALVGYAEQVGSLLVAEGVEQSGELRRLRQLGVPLIQGFYLARPGKPWPQTMAATGAEQAGAGDTIPAYEAAAPEATTAGATGSLQPA
jgi:EAL domain-containing protein (putative c-di-GMP-specific phosphodiesterase class I)